MYAIIETGGKQFKVQVNDVINVEKLSVDAGETFKFDKVLAVNYDSDTTFGVPYVQGAVVSGTILGNAKGKKLVVYKYKRKSGYHKKKGHRQPYTKVKIDSITL